MAFTPVTTGINSSGAAKARLQLWLNAEQKLTIAETASIGDRQLTRADWRDVRDAIEFWQSQVRRLEAAEAGAKSPGLKVVKWLG